MVRQLSTLALERRAAQKARVAKVKALGIEPGDWIVSTRYNNNQPRRAYSSMLDARDKSFQWLRRATPTEIAAAEAEEAERKRRNEEAEAYRRRPDVRNAEIILAQSTEALLKLGPELLADIVSRLRG
jgi:hypothetical protein